MIKVINAVKTYGARTVLNVNEATFKEGRIYAVIGANGCGKSTLLQAISGTIKLNSGSIVKDRKVMSGSVIDNEKSDGENLVKDEKSDGGSAVKDRKLDICYMPQNSVGFAVSVKNNVEIAGKGLDRKLTKESAHRLLSDLGLWQLRRKNAAKLSGGETQRLSLARSLVVPHDVLLLDEPTAAMDVGSACVAEGIIKDYAKKH
ncbi:MAG: ATP-binding cassette domain-containing protein, partial [Clostridia bacterium]